MSDIYVDVGPMAFSKDPSKVAAKFTKNAKALMRKAAVQAVNAVKGFTTDSTKAGSKAYYVDLTLSEVKLTTYQNQPAVACKVSGVVATYPDKAMLTQSLSGSTMLGGGNSERDVEDCITEVVKGVVADKVIPFLKARK